MITFHNNIDVLLVGGVTETIDSGSKQVYRYTNRDPLLTLILSGGHSGHRQFSGSTFSPLGHSIFSADP